MTFQQARLVNGPQPVTVVLAEPDPLWPQRFSAEAALIGAALGDRALAVHHIGSTSVPGLAAKDVVDVCVCVADPDDEPAYLAELLATGLELRVREPGHRCLRRVSPAANVHVYAPDAPQVSAYLRLRDRLRGSDADRLLYERRKRALAAQGEWADMNVYSDAKSDVIAEILARG